LSISPVASITPLNTDGCILTLLRFNPFIQYITVAIITVTLVSDRLHAQAETVPADHSVYEFLYRMEVMRLLPRYHGTVVPLSRKKVGEYISQLYEQRDKLSATDRKLTVLYYTEFVYDIERQVRNSTSLFSGKHRDDGLIGISTNRQKYLYFWYDTSGYSMFVDGAFSVNHRVRSPAETGESNNRFVNLINIGGRIRGTLHERFGYYVDASAILIQGSRNLAREENRVIHSHSFRRSDENYAERSMGYIRYDAGIAGIQLGRERIEWRESLGSSLFLSSNAPMFNFFRLDISYGAVNYNYVHGSVLFHNYREIENNKYIVASRFEFSIFDNRLKLGFNQTTMYDDVAPNLAYLNPFSIFEATERNLGDRHSSMIGFDVTLRPFRNFEFKSGALFDDIHVRESFLKTWNNMWSIHTGFFYTSPFGIENIDILANYTRIEPHVYSHHRDAFLHHEHDGFLLGHPAGPNSDEIITRINWRPTWQWRISLEYQNQRHGDNIYDDNGEVILNAGGNIYVPWDGDRDPTSKIFLDGILTRSSSYRAKFHYEIVRQIEIGTSIRYLMIQNHDHEKISHLTFSVGIWVGY
jgi:hypothetical protein